MNIDDIIKGIESQTEGVQDETKQLIIDYKKWLIGVNSTILDNMMPKITNNFQKILNSIKTYQLLNKIQYDSSLTQVKYFQTQNLRDTENDQKNSRNLIYNVYINKDGNSHIETEISDLYHLIKWYSKISKVQNFFQNFHVSNFSITFDTYQRLAYLDSQTILTPEVEKQITYFKQFIPLSQTEKLEKELRETKFELEKLQKELSETKFELEKYKSKIETIKTMII